MKKLDDENFHRHKIHIFRRLAVGLIIIAMITAVTASLTEGMFGSKYDGFVKILLTVTIGFICLGSGIMFVVIIYALNANVRAINESIYLEQKLNDHFANLNKQNPKFVWKLSKNMLYISVNKQGAKSGSGSDSEHSRKSGSDSEDKKEK